MSLVDNVILCTLTLLVISVERRLPSASGPAHMVKWFQAQVPVPASEDSPRSTKEAEPCPAQAMLSLRSSSCPLSYCTPLLPSTAHGPFAASPRALKGNSSQRSPHACQLRLSHPGDCVHAGGLVYDSVGKIPSFLSLVPLHLGDPHATQADSPAAPLERRKLRTAPQLQSPATPRVISQSLSMSPDQV